MTNSSPFFYGQTVLTPYGECVYVSSDPMNSGILKLNPLNWTLSKCQIPIFFLHKDNVKPLFKESTIVYTIFGKGCIKSVPDVDNIFIVELLHWKLADHKSPVLYLQESALSILPINISKMNNSLLLKEKQINNIIHKNSHSIMAKNSFNSYEDRRILKAITLKIKAENFYKKKDFLNSRSIYLKTLETMQVGS